MIVNNNFFEWNFSSKFDGIITDPPYKHCINDKLEEERFNVKQFMQKSFNIVKQKGFLICFSNFAMSYDLRKYALETGWKFHCYQIWNKEPTRTWISWSFPLRSCEFILYFTKGNFKFNFKTGIVKPPVKRSSFGGKLKDTKKNTNTVSYEMFREIIVFKNPRNKIHPTEKPIEFSTMFKQIVSDCKVLDPFCGTGNLIKDFSVSTGMEINYKFFINSIERREKI